MKFTADKEGLALLLGTVSRAAGSRGMASPVLTGVLLRVADGVLTGTATDLDLTISGTLGVTVTDGDDGGAVAPATLLSNIVKSLEPGSVSLVADKDLDLAVAGGGARFSIRAFPSVEFPRVGLDDCDGVSLSAADFVAGVRQVLPAASNDDARPILTAVLMSTTDGPLRMVATDSYRLAVRDVPAIKDIGMAEDVLVPKRALTELLRMIPDDPDDEIVVRFGSNQVAFDYQDWSVTTRLIDGTYPQYQQLIPESFESTLTVGRETLLGALKRAALLTADNTTPVKLSFGSNGAIVVVTGQSGDGSETVGGTYEGEDCTVGFNPRYIAEALGVLVSDEVQICLGGGSKPCGIRGLDDSR